MLAQWFRNLPVKRKMALLAGFFSLVLIAMLTLAVRDARDAQGRTEAMYDQDLLPTGDLTMVRNGACLKCQTCGATTGCS